MTPIDLQDEWRRATSGVQSSVPEQNIEHALDRRRPNPFQGIVYAELIGAWICLLGAAYIGYHLYDLLEPWLQVVGVVAILLLLAISTVSWLGIRSLGSWKGSYSNSLKEFTEMRLHFNKLQRLNLLLCHVLLVMVLLLMSALFQDHEAQTSFLTYAFSVGYLFLLWGSIWVWRRYASAMRRAESLLQEIES